MEWPKVSVIVLNYNGKKHLSDCFGSLMALDYPAEKLEVMLVDNASADGSVPFVRERFPSVRIIQNEDNLGFAAGNNRGAEVATGEYIAFLNNDTRVDPQWVKELVRPCLEEEDVVCTASKILSWDGDVVDFVCAAMNFHGFAFQPNYGFTDIYDEQGPLLFACGGAMLIRRDIFLDVGGFDEAYFIYYEDVDLGWRLWLLGHRVLFAPKAVVYHRLHATMNSFTDFRKSVLFERNALFTLIKNYDDENLHTILPGALMMLIRRSQRLMKASGWKTDSYYIRNRDNSSYMDTVNRSGLAILVAADEVIGELPRIFEKRAKIQARRQRTDKEIIALFKQPMHGHLIGHAELDEEYAHIQSQVTDLLRIRDIFQDMPRRVLVISPDLLPVNGLPTTGAGLRAWSIGQGLQSQGHEVLYAMPRDAASGHTDQIRSPLCDLLWEQGKLHEVITRVSPDVVIACGWSTLNHLPHCSVPVVLDQHGPHILERHFQQYGNEKINAAEKISGLQRADFFTCAGERQWHYFLPWLQKAGFACPEEASAVVPVSLGGQWPALDLTKYDKGEDPIFVYGGIFLPWQDPALALQTLVERMEANQRGRLRIFGGKHPFHPIKSKLFDELIQKLAISERVEISPMLGREALLAEYANAHVALDLMQRNEERELAFTTRTVEYLWCGLPVIYNDYAELAEYIGPAKAGWTLNPLDKSAMVDLFDRILADPGLLQARAANARRLAEERLNWSINMEPIVQFCRQPYKRTPAAMSQTTSPNGVQATSLPQKGLRLLVGEALFHFRRGGVRTLVYETLGFLQRQI